MSINLKSLWNVFRKRKVAVRRDKYQLKAFRNFSEENKKHSVDHLRHSVDCLQRLEDRLQASIYHKNPYFMGLTESYWD